MKILAVDDEAAARLLLEASLKKWGYEPVMAGSCEEALTIHSQGGIGFVICDWVMPGEVQGVDLVNIIRSADNQDKSQYTYIILLTSKGEQKDVFEGIQAGADDYVRKPFDPKELRTRIQLGRRILTLRETNLDLARQLKTAHSALQHDSLTQTYNRQTIMNKLAKDLEAAKHEKRPLSLMVISAQNISTISYTYSYKAAEMAVVEIAKRLKSLCIQGEVIGRFNDTDFVVYLPGASEEEMFFLSNIIKSEIEQKPFQLERNITANIHTLIGISYSRPKSPVDVETLITQAFYQIFASTFKDITPTK